MDQCAQPNTLERPDKLERVLCKLIDEHQNTFPKAADEWTRDLEYLEETWPPKLSPT
jgi:hypothetical protein